MQKILWQPTPEFIRSSNMYKFMGYVNRECNLNISDYSSLYDWSIKKSDKFWELLALFCDINFSQKHDVVLSDPDDMLKSQWFVGSKLNFAENLLTKRNKSLAIISCNENMEISSLSYEQLFISVASFTKSLLERGIKPKDRVVGIISNIPEAVIAMLATSSIGAIWSSCSPEFGIEAIINRFQQIKPKLLISNSSYQYDGKFFDISSKLQSITQKIPSIKTVVLVNKKKQDLQVKCELVTYQDFLSPATQIQFHQSQFDHPLYILYSSGTTGKPKCIVHGAGGTLLQHSKELVLHTNITNRDIVFYYSSVGWMMWNWLVSSLKTGATVVLYNGSPIFPKIDILFDLIDQVNISVFGISAKYLALLEQQKTVPMQTHSLHSLRTILSTGSPLSEHSFDYVYNAIKPDICLSSISGGSDIISCFALGNPMKPVIRGELQCVGLGMSVKIFDNNGKSTENELGELVCTSPFPSRPIYFWNDKDFSLYKKSYYSMFLNIWRHGDYAMITANQGFKITGRSDTTLNPGGVRIGTAEIYQLLEKMPPLIDGVIIGKMFGDDIEVILFVVLESKNELTDKLIKKIKSEIKTSLSPRHVPNKIFQVHDVPRTFNDKKIESAIRSIFNNEDISNLEAIANPSALDEYYEIYNNLTR